MRKLTLLLTLPALLSAACCTTGPDSPPWTYTEDAYGQPLRLHNYRKVNQPGYSLEVGTDGSSFRPGESPDVAVKLALTDQDDIVDRNYRVRFTLVHSSLDKGRAETSVHEFNMTYVHETSSWWYYGPLDTGNAPERTGYYLLSIEVVGVSGLEVHDLPLEFRFYRY